MKDSEDEDTQKAKTRLVDHSEPDGSYVIDSEGFTSIQLSQKRRKATKVFLEVERIRIGE